MKKSSLIFLSAVIFNFILKAEVVPFPDLMRPDRIRVDKNSIYITDMHAILVYSAKDFKLQTKFGRQGEGPGEFMGWPRIRVLHDAIVVDDAGRILYFSKDGRYIKERKIPRDITLIPIKDHFFAINRVYDYKAGKQTKNIEILDDEFKKVKTIYVRFVRKFEYESKVVKKDIQMVTPYFGVDTDGENIYIADSSKGFYIDVFSADGDHLYTIKKNLEKLKLTKEYKDMKLEDWKGTKLWAENKRNFNYVFPEYFPDMKFFIVADQKIFVFTFREKDKKNECIILDRKGNVLNKTWLTVEKPFTIKHNKFYRLVENIEKEEYELHITAIKQGR